MKLKAKKEKTVVSEFSSFIELSGNREAVIEGCRGVLDFGESSIALSLGKMNVRIIGDELTVASFVYGQALVRGNICGLEFFSTGGADV